MEEVVITGALCDGCGEEVGPDEVTYPSGVMEGPDYSEAAEAMTTKLSWPYRVRAGVLRGKHRHVPRDTGLECGRVLFATEGLVERWQKK